MDWLGVRSDTSVHEVLNDCLQLAIRDQTHSTQTRVGKILVSRGWRRVRRTTDAGKRSWRYEAPIPFGDDT